MKKETKQEMAASIENFYFPNYEDIPNVGLYLEQVTKYINGYLAPLDNLAITPSMISNYVKKGLIANPVKKQYYREQIAYIFFIAVAKSVLSLDNIRLFMEMQTITYPIEVAYDYFCDEFKNVLLYVFKLKDQLDNIGTDRHTDEKMMLRSTIITVSHKIYLDKCFNMVRKEIAQNQ